MYIIQYVLVLVVTSCLSFQWTSDSITDMYADAVFCVIMKIASDTKGMKGESVCECVCSLGNGSGTNIVNTWLLKKGITL